MREDPIITKHPELFADCFDFSVPEGWRGIVDALCDALSVTGCSVLQVKEKFGGLRVYVDNATVAALAAINAAEKLAATTCQVCGAGEAKLRAGGWARTLCEGCAK
ncbi:MAG: hypothetical protein AMXMBFR56_77100 [Polyangiaceae bacterium]